MSVIVPASGALLEQILDDTYVLWGEGLTRAGYGAYNLAQTRAPWGEANLRRVALVDGTELLASAKRYTFHIRLDGRRIKALGLGAVFTPVDRRGHGHAADLVRRLVDDAANEGYGYAILFSEIDPRYYERLGFARVPMVQWSLTVREGRRPGAPFVPIRSGDFGDLKSIVEMNEKQSRDARLTVDRDLEHVRFAITKKRLLAACGQAGHRQVEFFVEEEGGRAAAYVVLLEVANHWMMTECGDRDPTGARVGAILQALVARDDAHPRRVRAWLPAGFLPPQLAIDAKEVPGITMMIRPLASEVRPNPPLTETDIAWWHGDAF